MPDTPKPPQGRRRRRLAGVLALVPLTVLLSGCQTGDQWYRMGLPAPVTQQAKITLALWQGSWIAAWAVGAFMWALILGSAVFFRKRGDELPRQVRYNVPIEVLYTIVPFVIIAVLFTFTARDQSEINKLTKNPDVTVHVVGFQWSWQFNYDKVNGQNGDLQITGRPGEPPQLVLPVGERIRFVETSPDVIHSFWVIPFLFKRDVIPGRTNEFEVTINTVGTFQGKCTEFCGMDHSRMLFTLKAVPRGEFTRFMTSARALAQSGKSPTYTTLNASTATGSSS